MHAPRLIRLLAVLAGLLLPGTSFATNPLILDQFTADPTARVFDGKLYLYPSHDIVAAEGQGRPGWFCMEDYHVFSSDNLTDWQDHGVIVSQTGVPWANPASYSLWAPDCVFKNGKYFFFFPALAKEGGFRIGVATAEHPEGPFTPDATPIEGVRGIDPCVLIDRDGSAYLYYAQRHLFVVKLKDNLREIDGLPQQIAQLPEKGLIEGPFVFERNGLYYLTYPHVEHKTERLEYAISNHPLGPFKPAGVLMDESPSGCWTNHQSIVEFQGQWYLFYHDNDLSPAFDKARSARADRLFFNDDGTIKKVVATLRGVGTVDATRLIQIDRYTALSRNGSAASFLDPANPKAGWKLTLVGKSATVRFDSVEFGKGGLKKAKARAVAAVTGVLEIRLDNPEGPALARLPVSPASSWQIFDSPLKDNPTGLHNLFVSWSGDGNVDVDWVTFE